MISQLSFVAHLRSSSGALFSFYLLRADGPFFSGISWSLGENNTDIAESETFVESCEEASKTWDLLKEESAVGHFACRNLHSCDYTNHSFKHSHDTLFIDNLCSIDFSESQSCTISIISQKQTRIQLSFFCSKEKAYNLKPNDFLGGSVRGSVSYFSGEADELIGNGWITAINFYGSEKAWRSNLSFVLFGSNGAENCCCVSTCQGDECDCLSSPFSYKIGDTVLDGRCNVLVSETWTDTLSFQRYPKKFSIRHSSSNFDLDFVVTEPKSQFFSVFSDGLGQTASVFSATSPEGSPCPSTMFGIIIFFGKDHRETTKMMELVGYFVHEEIRRQIMSPSTDPIQQWIYDAVYSPLRALVNRGGKSWRSFLFCILSSFWGTPGMKYIRFCLIVELLHLGSLIIDDIEDGSTTRRGCPCVHTVVGSPLAINSGCSCYFLALKLADVDSLPSHTQLAVYQLTMETLRIGHIGQGLDIFGIDKAVSDAIKTQSFKQVFELLEYIHSSKSGEFVGFICKLACILSGAPRDVIEPIYHFGRSVGVAFQIINDVLDIMSKASQKFAEDISNGKITYPIAKALQLLPPEAQESLYGKISSRPSSLQEVQEIINIVTSTKAIPMTKETARKLLEDSWITIEPLLPTSIQKRYLFCLCRYIVKLLD